MIMIYGRQLLEARGLVTSCFFIFCFGRQSYFQWSASGSFGKRPIDLLLGDDFSFALNVPTEIHSLTIDSGTVRSESQEFSPNPTLISRW